MSQALSLHARQMGEPNHDPLVILHGLLGTSDNWQTLGKAYAKTHFVHLIDQRNHGRSPHHPEHSYAKMAQDLEQYINTHGLERITLLGHSMGGKTALMFAHMHPERIEKIIVADIASHAYSPHHQPIFDAIQSAQLNQAKNREEIQQHLMNALEDSGVVAFLMKNARRLKEGGFQWRPNVSVLASALGHVVDAVPLEINTLPTLVIYGGQSNYVEQRALDDFHAACMQLDVYCIQGAGHWLHASHPEEFFEVTLDFIMS